MVRSSHHFGYFTTRYTSDIYRLCKAVFLRLVLAGICKTKPGPFVAFIDKVHLNIECLFKRKRCFFSKIYADALKLMLTDPINVEHFTQRTRIS